jgi:hypothetical protein
MTVANGGRVAAVVVPSEWVAVLAVPSPPIVGCIARANEALYV